MGTEDGGFDAVEGGVALLGTNAQAMLLVWALAVWLMLYPRERGLTEMAGCRIILRFSEDSSVESASELPMIARVHEFSPGHCCQNYGNTHPSPGFCFTLPRRVVECGVKYIYIYILYQGGFCCVWE